MDISLTDEWTRMMGKLKAPVEPNRKPLKNLEESLELTQKFKAGNEDNFVALFVNRIEFLTTSKVFLKE